MGIADSYRVLADALAALETHGVDVTGVTQEVDENPGVTREMNGDLSVTVDLTIPTTAGESNRSATAATGVRSTPHHPLVGVPLDDRRESTADGVRTDEAGSGDENEEPSKQDETEKLSTVSDGGAVETFDPPGGASDTVTEAAEIRAEPEPAPTPSEPRIDDSLKSASDGPADAGVPCRYDDCDATFENEHGMKIHYSKVHRDEGETLPYEDPETLREVYDRHETFAEMTAALDVDVAPNTVRRYMIEHGIHDPDATRLTRSESIETERSDATTSDSEGSDTCDEPRAADSPNANESRDDGPRSIDDEDDDSGDGEELESSDDETRESKDGNTPEPNDEEGSEPNDEPSESGDGEALETEENDVRVDETDEYDVPDDVDLPRGVTVEDVVAAVTTASTVYEVGRDLRVSRERAQRLLRDLDLLDLVTGRLATRPDPDQIRREVDARLRGESADVSLEAD